MAEKQRKDAAEEQKPSGAVVDQKQWEEKQKILEMSEVSLWLDNYDDIFSDFDPRPYSQRSLSDDFLNEAKKASRDKADKLELRLLVSQDKRDPKIDITVKKRLRDHFNKHAHLLKEEIKKTKRNSLTMVLIGLFLMLSASYVNSLELNTLLYSFLFVLLEPAGWFMTWFGLDGLFYASQRSKTEYDFYRKMSKCEIEFSSY